MCDCEKASSVRGAGAEGWKLVPVEPTKAMEDAHFEAHAKAKTVFADVAVIWKAMLAAAPRTMGEG